MFGVAAGAPLDIIRVRQQQPGRAASSALQVLRSILALEGSRSLFKGMAYPLWSSAVQVGAWAGRRRNASWGWR